MQFTAKDLDSAFFLKRRAQGFLVVDGPNGAGKSTLIKSIAALVTSLEQEVLLTREPGGSPLGIKLRELVLSSDKKPKSFLAELLLFAADRAEHVSSIIRPSLESNKCVISDRYYYSTIAFQGHGRGIPMDTVSQTCQLAVDNMLPDLVVLLDLDPAEGLKRTKQRGLGDDSFENEELEFHKRLRQGFLGCSKELPEPFIVLDASKTAEEVFEAVKTTIINWANACGELRNGKQQTEQQKNIS